MGIGARIQRYRHQRGWTLRELGMYAKIDFAWISRLESGEKHNISLESATRLAQALGVSLDYLAGLTSDPTPPRLRRTVGQTEVEVGGF